MTPCLSIAALVQYSCLQVVAYDTHSSTKDGVAGCCCKHFFSVRYLCLGMVHELLIPEVGVHFHLYSCRLDASIAQQIINLLAAEVGDANGLD